MPINHSQKPSISSFINHYYGFCILMCILGLAVPITRAADSHGDRQGLVQACSYDGSSLVVRSSNLMPGSSSDAPRVIAEIMKYTGLPQNFDVVEGNVPNAAAVIVLGEDKLPRRVIAYNREFMNHVRKATQNNNWAPISIMAHEVGHHLSGHTILPGGSQPPTELEADKFSGFVLYKMGASLTDAQIAMETLVPDRDSPTHPARNKRLLAIQDGWRLACSQQSDDCKGSAAVASQNTSRNQSSEVAPDIATNTSTASQPLPIPDLKAIPSKFDRFVVDELGILDPAVKTQLAKDMYANAEEHNVEVVTLITAELHGRTAEQYAYDMMRQLRVGKLDVGNGAVLVIAPNQQEVGVALGSGLFNEFDDRIGLIESPLRSFMKNYDSCSSCMKGWSPSVARASDLIVRDTQSWEWDVRYQNLDAMLQAEKAQAGSHRSPTTSTTWRKLVRVHGRLMKTPSDDALGRIIHDMIPEGGQALELRTEEGSSLVVYMNPHVSTLMPAPLDFDSDYSMVLRESNLHLLSFDLISYDRL